MPLVAVVVVDREGKIRLGAAALVERETSEDFSWFLNWMVTNSSWYPQTVYSDKDLALQRSLKEYDGVNHALCFWHILQNVKSSSIRIKDKVQRARFLANFTSMRYSLSADDFNRRWHRLLQEFPIMEQYMNEQLGRDTWALWVKCYQMHYFNMDMSASSIAESFNSQVRKVANGKTTLVNSIEQISKLSFAQGLEQSSTWTQSRVANNSSELERLSRYYGEDLMVYLQDNLSTFAFAQTLAQMYRGVAEYRLADESIAVGDAQELVGVQGSSLDSVHYDLFLDTNASPTPQTIQNETGSRLVWVQSIIPPNSRAKLVISTDFSIQCSCCMPVTYGIPCRHYFAWYINDVHAQIVPLALYKPRWYKQQPTEYRVFSKQSSDSMPEVTMENLYCKVVAAGHEETRPILGDEDIARKEKKMLDRDMHGVFVNIHDKARTIKGKKLTLKALNQVAASQEQSMRPQEKNSSHVVESEAEADQITEQENEEIRLPDGSQPCKGRPRNNVRKKTRYAAAGEKLRNKKQKSQSK
ncbi:hypothetical protein MP228_002171 [Amoeboaphelidium protococcarum]|nr:hypothetical protein MP228_002171 [Amoeboaphelidium protococcarum]